MPEKQNTIAIAYRIYPGVSKVPPIHSQDKYKLSELCLKSLSNALEGIDYKMWVLLDNCPKEYHDLFRKFFDKNRLELIDLPGIGNAGTFEKQIEILEQQEFSDNIYFAEDDYFYLKESFQEMLGFLGQADADFISPYDHLDYYELDLHNYKSEITFFGNRHWRTAATTCMTFLTKKRTLEKTRSVFMSYVKGNYDASLWMTLTKHKIFNPGSYFRLVLSDRMYIKIFTKLWLYCPLANIFAKRFKLYTPLPSLATHMDGEHLSPIINWNKLFNE